MERSVSVYSGQNIRENLWRWSTLTGRTGATKIFPSILTNKFIVPLLFSRFHLYSEFEKGMKKWYLLIGPVWSENVSILRSFFLGYPTGLWSDRSIWYNESTHVFLRFSPFACFPVLFTPIMFSRAFHPQHVFPRFSTSARFPALFNLSMFSRAFLSLL